MTTPETQILPWVPRVFDAEKDTRNGKTLLILKEGSEFQIGTTYVQKGRKPEWKENTFKLVLRLGDEITMHTSDSPEFLEIEYKPLSEKDKPNRFRVTREILENVLEDAQIAVLKERKVPEITEETALSVKDLLGIWNSLKFSVKRNASEDEICIKYGIRKSDTLVVKSKDATEVSVKILRGKLEHKGEPVRVEVTMPIEDFERLAAVDGVTNFRKKALALLEETK